MIRRIREAGYSFKKQTSRVDLYRQSGTKQRLSLPRRDLYDEKHVRIILAQAGLTPPQIEEFLRAAVKVEN